MYGGAGHGQSFLSFLPLVFNFPHCFSCAPRLIGGEGSNGSTGDSIQNFLKVPISWMEDGEPPQENPETGTFPGSLRCESEVQRKARLCLVEIC